MFVDIVCCGFVRVCLLVVWLLLCRVLCFSSVVLLLKYWWCRCLMYWCVGLMWWMCSVFIVWLC